ncbi:MAG: hypothetical protein IJC26_02465 [Clostridia bacterium]|nr:hypothetical protein [Clostridia bacterium]
MKACKALGMESLFGIEFSAKTELYKNPKNGKNGSFHLTAFDFDPEYPAMKEYLRQMAMRETDQTEKLFRRGVEIGYIKDITWQEVLDYNKGIEWLCNDHVFRAMKAKGLVTDLDYNEFFQTCFGKHRNSIPKLYDYKYDHEIIQLVHDAGGIVCLAHLTEPLSSVVDAKEKGYAFYLDQLMEMRLDGVEVWHQLLNEEQRKEVYQLALERNLFISGGSDHSGICGGQYAFFEDPKKSRFYIEPLSTGTTKHHFEEMRDKKIFGR